MKVTLSKRAYFEICDALSFLSRVSLEASQKLYEEIYSKLDSLKDFPFAYPIISNELLSALEIRKMNVSNGRYGVLYSARNEEIANKIIEIENDGNPYTFVPRFIFKRKALIEIPIEEAEEIQFATVKQRREYMLKHNKGIYKA